MKGRILFRPPCVKVSGVYLKILLRASLCGTIFCWRAKAVKINFIWMQLKIRREISGEMLKIDKQVHRAPLSVGSLFFFVYFFIGYFLFITKNFIWQTCSSEYIAELFRTNLGDTGNTWSRTSWSCLCWLIYGSVGCRFGCTTGSVACLESYRTKYCKNIAWDFAGIIRTASGVFSKSIFWQATGMPLHIISYGICCFIWPYFATH